jgi:hypothetical protein
VNCVKLMSSMVQVLIKREYANLISDDSWQVMNVFRRWSSNNVSCCLAWG